MRLMEHWGHVTSVTNSFDEFILVQSAEIPAFNPILVLLSPTFSLYPHAGQAKSKQILSVMVSQCFPFLVEMGMEGAWKILCYGLEMLASL